ncbi:MAG TPA: TolC family protein [Polyangiaceae bacterium]|nr:TolC family protein [Polyangiaceae bacterium]
MRTTFLTALSAVLLFSIGAFAQEGAPTAAAPPTAAATATEEEAFNEALKAEPGGLTATAVGKRAGETSYQAKASEEALRGAAARVDAAFYAFLPHLSGVASYTRLSEFTPPAIFNTGGSLVGSTQNNAGPIADPNSLVALPSSLFAFPLVFNNWNLQATIVIPITDYFLRINENYTAATHAREAARYDVATARAGSASDGEVAFYNWLRARGALVVAQLALQDQKTHLTDTKNLFTVGNASQVDVLRGETAVSDAELAVVRAQNLLEFTAKQLRVAMHIEDSVPIASGETIDARVLPPVQGNLGSLISEAQSARFEVHSLDANIEAVKAQARFMKAAIYPQITAYGDVIYANPNPRVFPQSDTWFPTWDLGARMTWSPNDIPTSLANSADFASRAAGLEAQKQALRDGIALEVTGAYQTVQAADFAVQSTEKQLTSAREAVRVARELFKAGRVTSTTLTDAETELTRARLSMLNARIDARTARVRLDHALGRDTRLVALP